MILESRYNKSITSRIMYDGVTCKRDVGVDSERIFIICFWGSTDPTERDVHYKFYLLYCRVRDLGGWSAEGHSEGYRGWNQWKT